MLYIKQFLLKIFFCRKKSPLQLTATYVLPLLFLQENLYQVLAGRVRVHLLSRFETRHMTKCKKTRLAEEGLGYDILRLISTRVYCVKVYC